MNKFDDLVEDYSNKPVPMGKTVSGFRVALILIGISIALPGFLAGTQIGQAVGFENAIIAFLAAGVILAVLGSMTTILASRARLSTYMLVQFSFGPRGANLVNFFLASTMFGWFGVNASLFGKAIVATLETMDWSLAPEPVYVVVGSVLMVLTTIFGFKALDKLSMIAVPLLIVILLAILTISLGRTTLEDLTMAGDKSMPLGLAISAVAGGNMVSVATLPDVGRYLTNGRNAIYAMILSYVIGMPVILLAAAVPSLVSGELDLMKIIVGLGLGLPALFVLIFATWTSNAANLYSSGLSLASIFKNIHRWKLTVLAGMFGTGIAVGGIVDVFIPFLISLAVVVPPVAGIYATHFYVFSKKNYKLSGLETVAPIRYKAFVAWAIGSTIAFLSANSVISMTFIPALDSILVAAVSYWLLQRYMPYGKVSVAKNVSG